jgi:hypothetical protein
MSIVQLAAEFFLANAALYTLFAMNYEIYP